MLIEKLIVIRKNEHFYIRHSQIFQKGCRIDSRGKKEQVLIEKSIVKDCRKILANLFMA